VWGNKNDEADSKRRERRGRLRVAKGRPRIQCRKSARKGGESRQCSVVRHLVEHFETRFLKFQVDSRCVLWAPPPSVPSLIVFSPVSRHPCYRLPQLGQKSHLTMPVLRAEKNLRLSHNIGVALASGARYCSKYAALIHPRIKILLCSESFCIIFSASNESANGSRSERGETPDERWVNGINPKDLHRSTRGRHRESEARLDSLTFGRWLPFFLVVLLKASLGA
jgi:hypothetical protein